MDDASLRAARLALDGISLGDSFGQVFLSQPGPPLPRIARRDLPPGPWRWSDDTAMALSIVEVLTERGTIDQDLLATRFARRFVDDPSRGYGAVAHRILTMISVGEPWDTAARSVYGGQGSMGNGGAMRVAPVGAYFASSIADVVRQARASAAVTHAHPEGQAGAIAVAVAAAVVHRGFVRHALPSFDRLLGEVLEHTPDGDTQRGIRQARAMSGTPLDRAARTLGDGSEVIAPDTVPFALFCAASTLGRFEDALFGAMSGLLEPAADRDTVCAIVGGVAALAVGADALPAGWLAAREPLPAS